MKEKVYTYESDDIEVRYDLARCIHAAECVRGRPKVFNPKRKPWVEPGHVDADAVAQVIVRCPTGALKFVRKDDGPEEAAPPENRVTVNPDGPLFVRGDVTIQTNDGETVLRDTRVALCRCGQSKNKPLCDGSHTDAGFTHEGGLSVTGLATTPPDEQPDGPLTIVLKQNGPFLLKGPFEVKGSYASVYGEKVSLCRCGGSARKPFCDGSHRTNGFVSE